MCLSVIKLLIDAMKNHADVVINTFKVKPEKLMLKGGGGRWSSIPDEDDDDFKQW